MGVTVLGCDGSWPGPGGAGSGYLVTYRSTTVWLDAGPGTFATLQQHVDPAAVDAVVVSHDHSDHWSDLQCLDTYTRFGPGRSPVPVFGPRSGSSWTGLRRSGAFDWHPLSDGDLVEIGELACRFSRTDHGPETLAVRMDGGGRSLGYSADSGPDWSFLELGTGIDLALCEATYTSGDEGTAGHMSGRQAGAQARHAGASRLVLTHRWPSVSAAAVAAEAAEAFGGEVEQAAIGKEYLL